MFRGLIDQLDDLNSKLGSAAVVMDDEEPVEEKKSFDILSSAHIAQVKAAAAKHNWALVEMEELFSMGKFEREGDEIEWTWNEETEKGSNKFVLNLWESGLRTVFNARTEHLEKIFGRPEDFGELTDCRREDPLQHL